MNYKDKIMNYLKDNNGIITTQYCRDTGIPTVYLTRLVQENILTRIYPEIYVKTIREYASSEEADINKLFIYAQKMGVIEEVRTAMETIIPT